MLKFSGSVFWRLGTRTALRKYSSAGATVVQTERLEVAGVSDRDTKMEEEKNSGLIAAAFASLAAPESTVVQPSLKSTKQSHTQQLDNQILNAIDINSLLAVAENPVVSRRHALKMVSVLSEWSSSNKVKLSDFEKDPRFLKLCRILARTSTTQAMNSITMAEDLSTVLGITGDDEAAKLITNLTLPQMIKVMKALHQKGRRSTPLLRALSYNITKQNEVIDLKKSADLLFCMAGLNFPDPMLLDRLCSDIIQNLSSNKKPAVINSIAVSLGILKYRHEQVLFAITEWIQNNKAICRASDISSIIVTLATVDYAPVGSDDLLELAASLKEEEMSKSASWLDLVFSLLILNKAKKEQLASTIRPEFIEKLLSTGEISIPSRRKLMMIDAYLHLTNSGCPRLPEDISVGVPVVQTKEKMLFVQCIMDTFKTLVSADKFMKKECNTGMGFLYDAEFAVDARCHPVVLERAASDKSVFRIAVLGLDYHDMTKKTAVPLGVIQLYTRLLQLKGFKVLHIPYTEFSHKDKLIARVQYIEKRLKELISNNNKS